jgi:hypothetical protein
MEPQEECPICASDGTYLKIKDRWVCEGCAERVVSVLEQEPGHVLDYEGQH